MYSIGKQIATLRKKRGMTQEKLASVIGVTAQAVSKWETGSTMPDIMLLTIIADTLKVTTDSLLGKEPSINVATSPEHVAENSCSAVLREMYSAFWVADETDYDSGFQEYVEALNNNDQMRTAILKQSGTVYYRKEFGTVALKRPADGWMRLLDNPDSEDIFLLLLDHDIRTVMRIVTESKANNFTISYLCSVGKIIDPEHLEEKINRIGLFYSFDMSLDSEMLKIYRVDTGKLFLFLAAYRVFEEISTYKNNYYNYIEERFYL